jgi:hypothetical protein
MSDRPTPAQLRARLNLTAGVRNHHDYRQDNAHEGRYLRRLPDRTLVWSDEYEERLREYLETRTSDR